MWCTYCASTEENIITVPLNAIAVLERHPVIHWLLQKNPLMISPYGLCRSGRSGRFTVQVTVTRANAYAYYHRSLEKVRVEGQVVTGQHRLGDGKHVSVRTHNYFCYY